MNLKLHFWTSSLAVATKAKRYELTALSINWNIKTTQCEGSEVKKITAKHSKLPVEMDSCVRMVIQMLYLDVGSKSNARIKKPTRVKLKPRFFSLGRRYWVLPQRTIFLDIPFVYILMPLKLTGRYFEAIWNFDDVWSLLRKSFIKKLIRRVHGHDCKHENRE